MVLSFLLLCSTFYPILMCVVVILHFGLTDFYDWFLFKNPHMSSPKQKASFVVDSFDIFFQTPLSFYLFLQSVSGAELKTNSPTRCLRRRDSAGGPTHLYLLAELRRTFFERCQKQRELQQTGESAWGAGVG